MKEITYFYLTGCPYCRMADEMIAELVKETPEFADITINKIEERENAELADSYDYYYVPCLWIGKEKLHEGVPTKEKIRDVLKAALED
ncbi:MAG: thioredoxin family protein [Clostridiales bacterium]|jgi:glutaredoxin|nr:thioredoxin family protein [Clostridiales bacterium]